MIDTESGAWRQTRIVGQILPAVAEETCFALKGGTAINLFVLDLRRLSVDIDLTYLPAEPRETALAGIDAGLRRIARRLSSQYELAFGQTSAGGFADTVMVRAGGDEVKIEVNPVLRQTLMPVRMLSVQPRVEANFGFTRMQVLSHEELYAGKLVAALDRQHPRDVFDAKVLLETQGLSETLMRAFIAYVAGHKNVMAHIVAPRFGDARRFRNLYETQLLGMTEEDVTVDGLAADWERLAREIRSRIGVDEGRFLLSLKRGEPQWDLLGLPGASEWPAIRWKMQNLAQMAPEKRRQAIEKLERALEQPG
ncbi:MAG: nucleotidyl transferase AbiEii/AbiGii toxin family protein [Anaerolineae bacterium]|nr:nucleotidyl transferase AbiEii/AbiGii toxin family protein [Anaerolineae bacterium]